MTLELSLRRSTWRPLIRIGWQGSGRRVHTSSSGCLKHPNCRCAWHLQGGALGLLNQSELRCRTGSGPSLSSSWKSSHHTTPQTDVFFTWAALYSPKFVIKSRTAKHCLLADHLSDRLTLQEIYCFIHIVLRFLFIDYYTYVGN